MSLDTKQRADLRALLPKRIRRDQAEQFLDAIAERVDWWAEQLDPGIHDADLAHQLEVVAAAARRLRAALDRLDRRTVEVAGAHFDALVWPEQPPAQVSERLRRERPRFEHWLRDQSEALADLVVAAEFAGAQITPTNVPRTRRQSRELAHWLVDAHQTVFGKRPPRSDWFFGLAAALGDAVGTGLGRDVIRAALSKAK